MPEITERFVARLYDKHADAMLVARKEQRELRASLPHMKAQLDDIEAEITYLLLREFRPSSVVEIGALHGWSTTWILRALRDSGRGHLHTYDRVDHAVRNVPPDLSARRWTFVHGDVRGHVDRLPYDIGYLFIDAAHSGRFARWYLDRLLPRVAPETPVSVHDVFHGRTPWPFSEGAVLLRRLADRGMPFFTAARAKAPDTHARLDGHRVRLGLVEPIGTRTANPMVFFRAGQVRPPAPR
ncbi:class I SAM-dependent methyltransferase [Actinopolymorpha sp. B9G3]|uniref:class I SAM-dependent methyltransferase n=1 Tax=Actinopolymorpha sp. B9G3 TaxID=3158970 RepID=UPI0032D8BE26